jgi:hypothetical protein
MNFFPKLLCLAALTVFPVMFAFSDAKADEVFAKYKESVTNSYTYLKEFIALSGESLVKKAVEAFGVLEASEKMVAELTAAMPEGFPSYEKTNPGAKEISFAKMMSFLKNYIEKGRDKMAALRGSLLSSIKSNVTWLERGGATMTAAEKLERVKYYFSVLDIIAKDDPKVAAAKKDYLPRAEAAYKAALAQIAELRMPADQYSGKDKNEVIALFTALYQKRTDIKPERIVIVNPDWIEQNELVVRDNVIYVEKYLYLTAHVAIKAEKEGMVYEVSFRKQKKGSGFGPEELYAFGVSYPILLANINK